MEKFPKISIITPSYNQGRFIVETIESVLSQGYPNLEHIIMDGGSTDNTLELLKKYPRLIVVSERDRGQADAINKGFDRATGDIFAFLNSDDTFLPGTLHRVAKEIDPAKGRHMVMGRCRFTDENGRYYGIEHPSEFESHIRILKIWKGYTLPQPAIFWTKEAWFKCGGMNLDLKYHLDYDLFCKMTKYYKIHCIDQVFATYRLHAESKSEQWTVQDRLEDSIELSRKHWGPFWTPKYWNLALSLAWYRFDRVGRARRWYLEFREYSRRGKSIYGIPWFLSAALFAPEVAFFMGVYPILSRKSSGIFQKFLMTFGRLKNKVDVKTSVYFDHTGVWNDGWTGPNLIIQRETTDDVQSVHIQGDADLTFMGKPLMLSVFIDGQEIGKQRINKSGHFALDYPSLKTLRAGNHTIAIKASTYFVHHYFAKSGDYRPLAWRVAQYDTLLLSSRKIKMLYVDHKNEHKNTERINFKNGWYDTEVSDLNWIKWSSSHGEIMIEGSQNSIARIRGELYSILIPNKVNVIVNEKKVGVLDITQQGFKPFTSIQFPLIGGENTIQLVSEKDGISTPTDKRTLAFAVKNLFVEYLPG